MEKLKELFFNCRKDFSIYQNHCQYKDTFTHNIDLIPHPFCPMNPSSSSSSNSSRVFWGCFVALVTCAFGFIVRTQVIGEWQTEFNLSETEKGDILGVGFWPFAFSIFLLSLIIDRVGYGRAAVAGLIMHIVSVVILLTADSARALYWGTFVFALSNGTVEAYINPTIATMYPREKVKWLNILHAGWPGGMVLAGMLAIALGDIAWQFKIGLILVPTTVYSLLLLGTKFPVSERVAAGVSFREMIKDFGALGTFVAVYLISLQVCQGILAIESGTFLWPLLPAVLFAAMVGTWAKSIGSGIYFIMLLIMIPLATTELGIDSWITDLMAPEMSHIGLNAGWVLVYTAAIMTVMRLFAGPAAKLLSPFGMLVGGSILAIAGLLGLSMATGIGVLIAATIYGLGKAYFWSTTLGIVGEQFPRGGALTMNCVGGVGMLGLSVGMVFLGNIQDRHIDTELTARDAQTGSALHETYVTVPKSGLFGDYMALDQDALQSASDEDIGEIQVAQESAKRNALRTAAIFPAIMLVSYVGLMFYFRRRGGYRIEEIRSET